MPTLKSTAAVLLLTLALGAAAQPTTQITIGNNTNNRATCAVFNWDRQPVSWDEYPPLRISAAFSCPNTTTTATNNTNACEIAGMGGVQHLLRGDEPDQPRGGPPGGPGPEDGRQETTADEQFQRPGDGLQWGRPHAPRAGPVGVRRRDRPQLLLHGNGGPLHGRRSPDRRRHARAGVFAAVAVCPHGRKRDDVLQQDCECDSRAGRQLDGSVCRAECDAAERGGGGVGCCGEWVDGRAGGCGCGGSDGLMYCLCSFGYDFVL
ncbi:hypothetical protein BP00DRAFT_116258 [Aspergillus indologenus CBS 114.80]|uniref:Uncharacterized protein n=1 Tax=Aspergillus indologenus CBS 114.80 TaxID=1450541 RepID=A0A2V5I9P7_9EURO|nr:hypothetical protein BP00DRAFT_116258 [Aspergillus indologenus CBS 114.80]